MTLFWRGSSESAGVKHCSGCAVKARVFVILFAFRISRRAAELFPFHRCLPRLVLQQTETPPRRARSGWRLLKKASPVRVAFLRVKLILAEQLAPRLRRISILPRS